MAGSRSSQMRLSSVLRPGSGYVGLVAVDLAAGGASHGDGGFAVDGDLEAVVAGGDGDDLAGVDHAGTAALPVHTLAARALMSRGSFVRHFKAATGTTPHAWVLTQRMMRAEELLEATDLPIEQIAEQVGYRNPAVFRDQFVLRRGVPPRDYRRTFSRGTRAA